MRKIIWSPKLHDFTSKKSTRWCELGQHIFISYKADPPTKICKYCKQEVVNSVESEQEEIIT